MLFKLVNVLRGVFWACIAASLYGALHNQISFTLSPEYFTEFKYIQFGLTDAPFVDRVKVGIIGVLASWWMGLIIGILLALPILIFADRDKVSAYFRLSLALVIGCAIVGAFGFDLFVTSYDGYYTPNNVQDIEAFHKAGSMHNGSYLGSMVGFLLSVLILPISLIRRR